MSTDDEHFAPWDSCAICVHSRVDHAGDECFPNADSYYGHSDGICNCDGFTDANNEGGKQ